jgi:hypothetical protein
MMSVNEFSRLLVKADFSEKGQRWFPSWVGKEIADRERNGPKAPATDDWAMTEFDWPDRSE